jgi:hypothetical protein
VRVDWPGPADEPGDVGVTANARPSDGTDAIGKDLERDASGADLADLPSALPDAAVRIELALAYRAKVDAIYDHHRSEAAESASWTTRDGTAEAEGKLFHVDADPLRVFGPAFETHPEEYREVMKRLDESGVEVDLRPGTMSYSPAVTGGEPGVLILDPQASYGAVLHEMSHFSDDESVGFPGLRYWLEDPAVTAGGESRAYQAEIDYANSIGEPQIADQIEQLKVQRIDELMGRNDE